MKTCLKCKLDLPEAAFFKDKTRRDGLYVYCRECQKVKHAAWREKKGKDADKASRAWQKAHPESHREASARYRIANRDACNARVAAWRKANPKRSVEYMRRRRAHMRGAPYGRSIPQDLLDGRAAIFGNRCAYCGGPHEHWDHVKPVSRGGMHIPANLRPACGSCNQSKQNKTLNEWREHLQTTSGGNAQVARPGLWGRQGGAAAVDAGDRSAFESSAA